MERGESIVHWCCLLGANHTVCWELAYTKADVQTNSNIILSIHLYSLIIRIYLGVYVLIY